MPIICLDLTFANCDCIDDCCDEENIEPVLPSERKLHKISKGRSMKLVLHVKTFILENLHIELVIG